MKNYEVIIIGGSFSGLAAALTLARSRRRVLLLDSGRPCNVSTPKSHNFLTRDGQSPGKIKQAAWKNIKKYPGVDFRKDMAVLVEKHQRKYRIVTITGELFTAGKLILATGLKDILPDIPGIRECWGKSVLHCPYCHGYEVINQKTAVLGNGNTGFELARLISHWTNDLSLFTNGVSTLSKEQESILQKKNIHLVETPIREMVHRKGKLKKLVLKEGNPKDIERLYMKPESVQQSNFPDQLNCKMSDTGRIIVDESQKTSVKDVFACGDNSNLWRSVSLSVSSGSRAGMYLNNEVIEEGFLV